MVKEVYGATYPIAYEYDDQGRMVKMTTQGQAGPAYTHWVYYPESGRLKIKRDDVGRETETTWTLAGRLKSRQLARETTSGSGVRLKTEWAYDNQGDLVIATENSGAGTVTWVRNRLGQVDRIEGGVEGLAVLRNELDGSVTKETRSGGALAAEMEVERTFALGSLTEVRVRVA